MSDNHNFDDDDDFFDDAHIPTFSRWKLLGGALAIVIVSGFGIGIWYAYDQGVKKGVQLAPPIIKADSRPVKEKPENPGGMDIPHQDKKVFDVLKSDKGPEKVEKLMAAPEEVVREAAPVDIPEAAPKIGGTANNSAEKLMEKPEETVSDKVGELAVEAKKVEAKVRKPAALPQVEPTTLGTPKITIQTVVAKAAVAAKKIEPTTEAKPKMAAKSPASPAKSAGVMYRVQLGAFRSTDAAEKAWLDLQNKHEELLNGISYKIQSAEIKGKGMFHRLQVGTFEQKTGASSLCSKLKAQSQDCLIAKN